MKMSSAFYVLMLSLYSCGAASSGHSDDISLSNEIEIVRYVNALHCNAMDSLLEMEVNISCQESLNHSTVANDFLYYDLDYRKRSLHKTEADKLLLIFYDPECTYCSDVINILSSYVRINEAIHEGRLKVLAIYAEGKRDVWEDTKYDLPSNWDGGYDLTGIHDNELYDLPAMPTIYLLDSSKHVLLKDPPIL